MLQILASGRMRLIRWRYIGLWRRWKGGLVPLANAQERDGDLGIGGNALENGVSQFNILLPLRVGAGHTLDTRVINVERKTDRLINTRPLWMIGSPKMVNPTINPVPLTSMYEVVNKETSSSGKITLARTRRGLC